MRQDEVEKLRAVVDNGPNTDKDFIRYADDEWKQFMLVLDARVRLQPRYATVAHKKTKEKMSDRKYDYYYRTCNNLDTRLAAPDYATVTPTFERAVREAAREAFDQVHADVYAEMVSFLDRLESSTPVAR